MKPSNIDIHAHMNFRDFSGDRKEVIERAHKNGVYIINIGIDHNTSIEVARLTDEYKEGVYAIVGLHPAYTDREDFIEQKYADFFSKDKIVGVGECGLDFFHMAGDIDLLKEKQEKSFRDQIEFAIKMDKPIMIHCRDAYPEVIQILRQYKRDVREKLRGNVHFFSGSKSEAKDLLDLDFTISFTGVITFASQYKELVEFVPLEKIHAETDCPYVAPIPNRGKRNEPVYVLETVKKISEIKGLSVEETSHQLVKNAIKLFNLPF